MLAVIPKHKGTEKLQADLKRRLARLEDEEASITRSGPRRVDPGHVHREGAGQWVLLGPPNSGKSSLLAALTHAHPEIGDYPFTTRAPLPGMTAFEDVPIQLVDTPPVSADHTEPYLVNLAHNADGLLLVFDVAADDTADAARLLFELLSRARVWPRVRPLPARRAPLPSAKAGRRPRKQERRRRRDLRRARTRGDRRGPPLLRGLGAHRRRPRPASRAPLPRTEEDSRLRQGAGTQAGHGPARSFFRRGRRSTTSPSTSTRRSPSGSSSPGSGGTRSSTASRSTATTSSSTRTSWSCTPERGPRRSGSVL